MSGFQLVLCNVPKEATAQKIAKTLLCERLCACVNIIPRVQSLYIWDGQIEEAEEYTLLIKTMANKYASLEAKIRELHPYSVPEILAVDISHGLAEYLTWLTQSLNQ